MGSGVENEFFPWLRPSVLLFLATCDSQLESFKGAAIELPRFAFLVGPDHGVVTVVLVTFDGVGTVSVNSHGVPSHGSKNQLHPSLYVSGPLAGRFFQIRSAPSAQLAVQKVCSTSWMLTG